MKNKIKKFLFLTLLVCTLGVNTDVNAFQTTTLTSQSGKNVASPGSEITYTIALNTDETITGYKATLDYDSSILSLVNITNIGWSGTNSTNSKELVFTSNGTTGESNIASLKFKVANNTTKLSTILNLKGISVCVKTDQPSASSDSFCPNGDIKTLTFTPKTISIKSSDNTLSSIRINNKAITNFNKNSYAYTIDVESNVDKAVIKAIPTDKNATFQTGFGNRTVDLDYGENEVKIKVLSETGEELVYTIMINRTDDRTTDNYLSEITIDNKQIENFDKKTLTYNVKVYKKDTLKINAITQDSKATFKVEGPAKLAVGKNTFKIVVTSESGDTLIYTLYVENIDQPISKKLKTLSISGYNINFDKNNQRYEILYQKDLIKNLKLYFTQEALDDEVKITVSPDIENDKEALENLKPGDEITITIEGIDGEKEVYTIVLKKDTRINFFFVLELIIMIGLIIAIIVVVRNNKRGSKKVKEQETNNEEVSKEVELKEEVAPKKVKKTRSSEEYLEEKPKRRRFSIYDDEYEEVEIEVDDDDNYDELEKTKEYK